YVAVPRLGLGVGDLGVGLVAPGRVHVVLGREQVVHVATARLVLGAHALRPRVLGVDAVLEQVRARVDVEGQEYAEARGDAAHDAVGAAVDALVHRVARDVVAHRLGRRVGRAQALAERGARLAGEQGAAHAHDGPRRCKGLAVAGGGGDGVDARRAGRPREGAGGGVDL